MKQEINPGSPKTQGKGYRCGVKGSAKDNGVKRPSSPVSDYPWPTEKKAKIK